MKKLILTIILATLTITAKADPDFSPLLGHTLDYAIENFGPARYQGTTVFNLHDRHDLVDIYLFNLGYGLLVVWVNQEPIIGTVRTLPAHRIVLTHSYLRHTGNAWRDAFGP
jgi:hypothetical protein